VSARLGPLTLALAIGGAGGWAAAALQLPLAWMIGAMLATTVAAAAGLPVQVSMRLRAVMVAVLGVMLGSSFSPAILGQLGQWALSLSCLVAYIVASGALCYLYLRRIGGYDPTTAFFAGMPGGLSEMILVGSEMGGDARVISLSHASRILLVVLALPFAFQLLAGYQPAQRPPLGAPLVEAGGFDLLVLAACAVVGFLAARALRLPAAPVVGPMVLSAAVHLGGVTDVPPPFEIVAAAQVVVGAAIGCRFAGVTLALIARVLLLSVGVTLLLLSITLVFAGGLAAVTGQPLPALILAFAPGGLAEMSLIAVALSMDAAFVATHHIVRIFLIVVAVPTLFRKIRRPR